MFPRAATVAVSLRQLASNCIRRGLQRPTNETKLHVSRRRQLRHKSDTSRSCLVVVPRLRRPFVVCFGTRPSNKHMMYRSALVDTVRVSLLGDVCCVSPRCAIAVREASPILPASCHSRKRCCTCATNRSSSSLQLTTSRNLAFSTVLLHCNSRFRDVLSCSEVKR